ncbi:MAG: TIGR02186 family protein [bacterium]
MTDSAAFTEALIRIRTDEGLYSLLEGAVDLTEQTLFRSRIALPANLTEGRYDARIFLVRDGAVIDVFEAPILVRKVGLERWLFNLAQSQPLAYGLLTLVIAVLLGWMASVTFQRLRR